MPVHTFLWTKFSVCKIEDNGLTVNDVEHAVLNDYGPRVSRSSGRSAYVGPALDGRTVFVVYEPIDAVLIMPITAFYVGE